MGKFHLGNTDGYNPVNPSLPKFTVGSSASINDFQKLTRGIDRATIASGNGYEVARYSNSTVIRPKNYVVGGKFRNFQVYAYTDKNGNGIVTVSIGTVNRTIPKIGSMYMDQTHEVDGANIGPTISVNSDGYIVVEATYDANKPFPSESEVKFVTDLTSPDMMADVSQFPLARVVYKDADAGKKTPADVVVSQIHESGNLAVSRVKIGSSKVYWQWWRI
jgi:hypothetical protein